MKNYEQLEVLLLHKDYPALTEVERSFVQSLMTESEYQTQRDLLLASAPAHWPAPAPPPRLARSLQAVVSAKRRPPLALGQWAAIAAALVGVYLLGRWSSPSTIEYQAAAPIVQIEQHTDTLYLEKWKEVSVPSYRYRERVVRDTIYLPAVANNESPAAASTFPVTPTPRDTLRGSRNARSTSKLLEMVVDVY